MQNATQVIVTNTNNQLTTTSKNIADVFGKLHKNVIQSIENLQADLPKEWYELNFQPIQIDVDLGLGRTRKDNAYKITRDGFTLLAMGFTGKKALEFKLAYIDQFNKMEKALQAPSQSHEQQDMFGANQMQLVQAQQEIIALQRKLLAKESSSHHPYHRPEMYYSRPVVFSRMPNHQKEEWFINKVIGVLDCYGTLNKNALLGEIGFSKGHAPARALLDKFDGTYWVSFHASGRIIYRLIGGAV